MGRKHKLHYFHKSIIFAVQIKYSIDPSSIKDLFVAKSKGSSGRLTGYNLSGYFLN